MLVCRRSHFVSLLCCFYSVGLIQQCNLVGAARTYCWTEISHRWKLREGAHPSVTVTWINTQEPFKPWDSNPQSEINPEIFSFPEMKGQTHHPPCPGSNIITQLPLHGAVSILAAAGCDGHAGLLWWAKQLAGFNHSFVSSRGLIQKMPVVDLSPQREAHPQRTAEA